MTRTPLSRSKGQRSRSQGRFTHHGLNASGSCSGQHGNVFGMENYCYVAVCLVALGAHRGRRVAGISWRPPVYSLFYTDWTIFNATCSFNFECMLLMLFVLIQHHGCYTPIKRLLRFKVNLRSHGSVVFLNRQLLPTRSLQQ